MLGFPMSFFSLSGWIPIWGVEAYHVYLLVPASKIRKRESPRQGTLQYSNGCRCPNVDGANSLSGILLGFPISQVMQPPFLLLNFLLYYFFLIWSYISILINKFLLANAVPSSNFPGSTRAGPRQLAVFLKDSVKFLSSSLLFFPNLNMVGICMLLSRLREDMPSMLLNNIHHWLLIAFENHYQVLLKNTIMSVYLSLGNG